jgi:molybdenum cofactor cytidylyltransferase
MSPVSSLCGVILAAGESTRMGRDKALLPWPPAASGVAASAGETMLCASIAALKPFTDAVIVVAGNNADKLAPVVSAQAALLVRNPAPERGQFSSMQTGLSEVLARGYNAAMITLVDCPPLSAASMKHLRASFDRALEIGKWGVAPENNGKHGHPLLASRQLIDAFLSAAATSNAREVKHAYAEFIVHIAVPDSLVSVDVNTPEQYAALSAAARSEPD